jgi:ABC-type transport system involved in Fe-S cluster assembly fused permease/ATPase subunit
MRPSSISTTRDSRRSVTTPVCSVTASAAIKSQTSLSLLNTGQQLIIAVGLVAMLWRATQGVVDGRMTLG